MKKTVIFRILMIIYLAAVATLCFADFGDIQDVPPQFLGIPIDKVLHFLMFLPFPILAPWCFLNPGRTPARAVTAILAIFLAGCIIAGATELMQGMLSYRTADVLDFMADSYGIAAGGIVSIIIIAARQHMASRNEA